MTTDTRALVRAALAKAAAAAPRKRSYTIDDAWLKKHDDAVVDATLAAVNRKLPGHNAVIAKRYAQKGADAAVAYLAKQNRILPAGSPMKIKTVVRNEAGQITAVIDQDVIAHEVVKAGAPQLQRIRSGSGVEVVSGSDRYVRGALQARTLKARRG